MLKKRGNTGFVLPLNLPLVSHNTGLSLKVVVRILLSLWRNSVFVMFSATVYAFFFVLVSATKQEAVSPRCLQTFD